MNYLLFVIVLHKVARIHDELLNTSEEVALEFWLDFDQMVRCKCDL